VEKILKQYRSHPIFEYIEPDYIVTKGTISPQATFPNDPSFNQLWGLHNTGQSGGTPDADIDAPEAWDIQKGNPNLVIGVIDTGVDYNHQDLVGNIWTNPGEIAGDGIDNDGNGYIDDIRGWDFAYNDNNPSDVDGHGTHVSGTIAGKGNNGVGVTGVAWNAKIMPLKFLNDQGSGSTSNAILAINYATAKGVKLTNNSWGGGGYSQALYDAINAAGQAGALFIAAAGNDAKNTDTSPSYPASYNLANIISVASTTRTDALSSFSNYGLTSVDLGAPGSEIYSLAPGGGYATLSGTSMASPHVAGAAALLWSQNPTWTAQQVKNALMNTGEPIAALAGKTVSGKRLNVFNALAGANLPSVTVSVSPASVQEDGTTNLVYTFTRTNLNLSSPLTVNFGASGIANAAPVGSYPADYNVLTGSGVIFDPTTKLGTVTFAAGATTATVVVDPIADTVQENSESVILTVNSGTGYIGGSPNTATGTIISEEGFTTYFWDDFANNSKGWTLGTEWQIGAATASTGHVYGNPDPGTDNTPTADNGVAGVVIGGNASTALHDFYYLTSPVINTSTANQLFFEFARWLNSDYTPFLQNKVEIFNGSSWVNLLPNNFDEAPGVQDNAWTPQQFDISAYKSASTQIRFGFNVGSSDVFTVSSWNLDDVKIYGDGGITTKSILIAKTTDGKEAGSVSSVFTLTRTGDLSSALTVNYTLAGTATLGSDYNDPSLGQATFAAGSSTATITLPTIDDSVVDPSETIISKITAPAGYTISGPDTATATIIDNDFTTYFWDDFANNSKGWTLGTEWQIGAATASTGHVYGNPDPGTDNTPTADNGVAGVVIGGNASTALHDFYYLTSPVINTSTANQLFFEFARWLNSDYTPYMQNKVEIFNGSSWVNLLPSNFDEAPGVQDNAWTPQQFDISAYKSASTQIRFGFNVGGSGVFTVSSWNLDDVKIYGDGGVTLPVITVVANDAVAGEPANNGQYTLTRTGDTTSDLTVNIAMSGTATNGKDYTAIPATVTFKSGFSTATVDLNVIDDTLVEGTETATLTVLAGSSYTPGSLGNKSGSATASQGNGNLAASATVSIADDEPPLNTITLDAADTGWYDVTGYHDPGNTNYFVGDLSLLHRNWFTFNLPTLTAPIISAQLKVNTYDYNSPQPSETYELRDVTTAVPTLTAGGSGKTAIYADLGDGAIYGSRTYTNGDDNQFRTIDLNAAAISALTAKSGQAFALGGLLTTLDTIDNSEYVFGFSEGFVGDVQLILNTGTATKSISIAKTTDGNEAGSVSSVFTLTRTGDLSSALTVNYTLAGTATLGSDYNDPSLGQATFAAGADKATITLPTIDDSVVDPSETIISKITAPVGYTISGPDTATATIIDDDLGILTLVKTTDGNEAGSVSSVFTLTRTGDLSSALTVNYTLAGTATPGVDYTGTTPNTVTFAALSPTATITLPTKDDLLSDPSETIITKITAPAGYTISGPDTATATILDNDGNSANNNLVGTSFADALAGVGGNNTLSGLGGNDTLDGGADNDTYLFDTDLVLNSDLLIDASGIDTLNFAATTAKTINLNLGSTVAQTVTAGNLTLALASATAFENVIGGSLNDNIIGNTLANSLDGGAGNDNLNGGAGNDNLTGGLGKDTLTGSTGLDTLTYNSLGDSLLSGFDVIQGYSGTGASLDRINAPVPIAPITLTASKGTATALTEAAIQLVLTNAAFAANTAAAFKVTGQSGTFIALNNGAAGFQAASDAIIQLSGYNIAAAKPVVVI
jgi:hypothetical protein